MNKQQYGGLNPIDGRRLSMKSHIESNFSILIHNSTDSKKEEPQQASAYLKLQSESSSNIVYDDYKHRNEKIGFIQHHVNDYIKCEEDITGCNAVKRIIHLLEFYDQNQKTLKYTNNDIVLLYEYISSLTEYAMSTFMEDWYHCKTKHLKSENDYKWFKSYKKF
eukprot:287386_1